MKTNFFIVIFFLYIQIIGVFVLHADVIQVPADYLLIQDAINNSNSGDTIRIASGTYTENGISVNEDITIEGQSAGETIIQAHENQGEATNNIFTISGGKSVLVKNLTLQNGKAMDGGAILNFGTLTIRDCNLNNNQCTGGASGGGAIDNEGTGHITILNCSLFNNNGAGNGGAIANWGTLEITNCTLSNNIADSGGGGIYSSGVNAISINSCTICLNEASGGGGFYHHVLGSATATIKNTIIANNNSTDGTDDIHGSITSADYNLFENTTGSTISGSVLHNIYNQNPLISPLAINNSINSTYTHHISSNSPARDIIPSSNPNGAPAQDQRGANRNSDYDIGAYEFWSEDAALPVELSSFTAHAGDRKVVLKWSTASELDNDAFIIQRSEDGENFELLSEIEGQGSTSIEKNYTFTDNALFNGFTYYYRLSDRDINGVITHHPIVNATPNSEGINFEKKDRTVKNFALHNNYPNPFNPETTISFDIPTLNSELIDIKLLIYNELGQLVATLYKGQLTGGQYELKWKAVMQPSGVYFLTLISSQFVQTQKMILLR